MFCHLKSKNILYINYYDENFALKLNEHTL